MQSLIVVCSHFCTLHCTLLYQALLQLFIAKSPSTIYSLRLWATATVAKYRCVSWFFRLGTVSQQNIFVSPVLMSQPNSAAHIHQRHTCRTNQSNLDFSILITRRERLKVNFSQMTQKDCCGSSLVSYKVKLVSCGAMCCCKLYARGALLADVCVAHLD